MRQRTGFTLLELILVIVILTLILGIGLPKLGSFLAGDELKASSLRLLGLLKEARNMAILEGRYFRVYLELGTPKVSIEKLQTIRDEESQRRYKKISGDVVIKELWKEGVGLIGEGEAFITFSPLGYSETFYVYLRDSFGREFTVGMTPFGTNLLLSEGAVGREGP